MFINTPMARRQWTGLDDKHLASIGFVNFGWNALERKFASLIWVTAGWDQDVGELVIANLAMFRWSSCANLLRQELRDRPNRIISTQAAQTGALFEEIRERETTSSIAFSTATRPWASRAIQGLDPQDRGAGHPELRTVAIGKADIDDPVVRSPTAIEFDQRPHSLNLVSPAVPCPAKPGRADYDAAAMAGASLRSTFTGCGSTQKRSPRSAQAEPMRQAEPRAAQRPIGRLLPGHGRPGRVAIAGVDAQGLL